MRPSSSSRRAKAACAARTSAQVGAPIDQSGPSAGSARQHREDRRAQPQRARGPLALERFVVAIDALFVGVDLAHAQAEAGRTLQRILQELAQRLQRHLGHAIRGARCASLGAPRPVQAQRRRDLVIGRGRQQLGQRRQLGRRGIGRQRRRQRAPERARPVLAQRRRVRVEPLVVVEAPQRDRRRVEQAPRLGGRQVPAAQDVAELEDHRRRLQPIPGELVARDVGQHQALARAEQRLQEHVQVLLARRHVAGQAARGAQIQLVAPGRRRKRAVSEPDQEDRAERDRAHRHERRDRDPACQVLAALAADAAEAVAAELGGDAVRDRAVAQAGRDVVEVRQRAQRARHAARADLVGRADVGGDQAADQLEPLPQRAQARTGDAGGKARVLDERAHQQAKSERRCGLARGRFGRKIVALAEPHRRVVAAARPGHERAQRHAAHALVPVEQVLVNVGFAVIAVIGAVDDRQLLAQADPVRGGDAGEARRRQDRGVGEERQQLAAREPAQRQVDEPARRPR